MNQGHQHPWEFVNKFSGLLLPNQKLSGWGWQGVPTALWVILMSSNVLDQQSTSVDKEEHKIYFPRTSLTVQNPYLILTLRIWNKTQFFILNNRQSSSALFCSFSTHAVKSCPTLYNVILSHRFDFLLHVKCWELISQHLGSGWECWKISLLRPETLGTRKMLTQSEHIALLLGF